ncbi:MAG: hypothetical protein PHO10_00155 [Gemmiger sp.]|nr:hypothetical protein [Gemmiger sp.]
MAKRQKYNNFYRRWQQATLPGGRAGRGRPVLPVPLPILALGCCLVAVWAGLCVFTTRLEAQTTALLATASATQATPAYRQAAGDAAARTRSDAQALAADAAWAELAGYPRLSATLRAEIKRAGGSGVTLEIAAYQADTRTLSLDATAGAVTDIQPCIAALEATGLFEAVHYGGYTLGADGYALALSAVLAAPGQGATP